MQQITNNLNKISRISSLGEENEASKKSAKECLADLDYILNSERQTKPTQTAPSLATPRNGIKKAVVVKEKLPRIPKLSPLIIAAFPSAVILALKPEFLPSAIDASPYEFSVLDQPFDLSMRNTAHCLLAYNTIKWVGKFGALKLRQFIYVPSSPPVTPVANPNSRSSKPQMSCSGKVKALAASTVHNVSRMPVVRLTAVATAALASGIFLVDTGLVIYAGQGVYSSGILAPLALGATADLTLNAAKTVSLQALNRTSQAVKKAAKAAASSSLKKLTQTVKQAAKSVLLSKWTCFAGALAGVAAAPTIWTQSPDAALAVLAGSVTAAARFAFSSLESLAIARVSSSDVS